MSSERAGHPNGTADERLAELKALLLGPDYVEVSDLRRRIDDPEARAKDVAVVLAEAVRLRAPGDGKLRKALQSTIEEAIGISVNRNPRMLADALFPIFGKAIRKSIAAELEGMVQSLSQVLEQSFSLRSLQWRWEALRTHRPYAEIVLLRSLLYRVEQAFLIHRKTGLLLLHAEAGGTAFKNPEMISGMLTALQDFVRDSISGAEDDNLETVRLGEFNVLMAYGPEAILAGFVRGTMHRNLNKLFQDELDSIHEENRAALVGFSGDTSKIESARPHLERCLVGGGEAAGKPAASFSARLLLFGVPLLLLAGLILWWSASARAERRWEDAVARIGAEPGIVITSSERRGGKYYLAGLRDPLAADPGALLGAAGIPAAQVTSRWEPYHSLDPRFAAQRKYIDAKEKLERSLVRFLTASAAILPAQQYRIDAAAAQIGDLLAAGHDAKVEITGHTDPTGTEKINTALARDRAANVTSALIAAGVPQARVISRGATSSCAIPPDGDGSFCRSTTFRVLE
jgi:outer membrane protein OmpA-like peptidoglycan-associated protein